MAAEPVYVEYIPGEGPVVISAPHGGYLCPEEIPKHSGCTEHDTNSQELARAISDQLGQRMPRPHLVVCKISREKVDVNRSLATCCDGHPAAERVYRQYHQSIQQALEAAKRRWGFAHLFDIHGQSHRRAVELGYCLTAAELCCCDSELDECSAACCKSSLQGLFGRVPDTQDRPSLSAMMRGPSSLGGILEANGVAAVPSTSEPCPDGLYFNGAYTTTYYGRVAGDCAVSATQVEPHMIYRQDHQAIQSFAAAFATAAHSFVDQFLMSSATTLKEQPLSKERVEQVLTYWYGPLSDWDRQPEASLARHQFWWQGGPDMDAHIASEYGALHTAVVACPDPVVKAGQSRRELAEQALARVIIISQFTRHIHRGAWSKEISQRRLAHSDARAFENDDKARKVARWMLAEGLDKELAHYEKTFLNLVFIQSEDMADQQHAVQYVTEMNELAIRSGRRASGADGGVSWCQERRETIRRFGRLPFRNAALGRESTPEEVAFLQGWRRGMA